MSIKPQYVYWDSSVFLAYMKEEPNRIQVIEALMLEIQQSEGRKKIVTSDVHAAAPHTER